MLFVEKIAKRGSEFVSVIGAVWLELGVFWISNDLVKPASGLAHALVTVLIVRLWGLSSCDRSRLESEQLSGISDGIAQSFESMQISDK